MPMEFPRTTGPTVYTSPFVSTGGADQVKVDVSTLTTDMVDSKGWLKPGVILKQDGTPPTGVNGEIAHGAVREAVKLPGRTDNLNLGTDTSDPIVAVTLGGLINRDIWRDNIGRDLNANELAALKGSGLKATTT